MLHAGGLRARHEHSLRNAALGVPARAPRRVPKTPMAPQPPVYFHDPLIMEQNLPNQLSLVRMGNAALANGFTRELLQGNGVFKVCPPED